MADRERRRFLRRAAGLGGSVAASMTGARAFAADDIARNVPPNVPEWSRMLGAPVLASPYGIPSKYEEKVIRRQSPGLTRTPHSSVAFTPLQNLFGMPSQPQLKEADARTLVQWILGGAR
jgi:sulfane dehydrogenase subunit SoxC